MMEKAEAGVPLPAVAAPTPETADMDTDSGGVGTLVDLTSRWASHTGMHGLSNITRTKSKFQRALWILLLLGGFGALIWQIEVIVTRYVDFDTVQQDSSDLVMPRPFPAVTLCNQNAARLSQVRLTSSMPDFKLKAGSSGALLTGGKLYSGLTSKKNRPNSISDATGMNYVYRDYYNTLSSKWRSEIGYSINNFLVECSFGGVYCDQQNFTTYLHPIYGNCFTFNAAIDNATPVVVEQVGPLFGLNLLLYIDQDEYIGSIAQSAGVVVTMHEPNKQPFPEDSGISVLPGCETQIGLTETHVQRLPSPYRDDCQADFNAANQRLNMFGSNGAFALPNLSYSLQACMKTCTQLEIETACGCSSSKIPSTAEATARASEADEDSNSSTVLGVCRYDFDMASKNISENALCAQRIERDSFDDCRSLCKPECDERIFDTFIALSQWPSISYETDAQSLLAMSNSGIKRGLDNVKSSDDKRFYISRNIVKLAVFHRNQFMHRRVSKPSYPMSAALSDTGGQVGLWLGLSVLTIFEILEVCAQIGILVAARTTRRRQHAAAQSKLSANGDGEGGGCDADSSAWKWAPVTGLAGDSPRKSSDHVSRRSSSSTLPAT